MLMQAWKRTLHQKVLEIIQYHGLVLVYRQWWECYNSTSAFRLNLPRRGQNPLRIEVQPDGLQCKNNLRSAVMISVRMLYPYGINNYKNITPLFKTIMLSKNGYCCRLTSKSVRGHHERKLAHPPSKKQWSYLDPWVMHLGWSCFFSALCSIPR